jgi:hypothetical protein
VTLSFHLAVISPLHFGLFRTSHLPVHAPRMQRSRKRVECASEPWVPCNWLDGNGTWEKRTWNDQAVLTTRTNGLSSANVVLKGLPYLQPSQFHMHAGSCSCLASATAVFHAGLVVEGKQEERYTQMSPCPCLLAVNDASLALGLNHLLSRTGGTTPYF